MNPLSKLILESADHNLAVDVFRLWSQIWHLGYSRQMIEDQAVKLGLKPISHPSGLDWVQK